MSDRETLEVYGAKAQEYLNIPAADEQDTSLDLFCQHLPDGAHVLDFGCGPGLQAAEFQARGYRVSALDATPAFVEQAEALGVDARLGTFNDLTEHATYDAVWASFSLLHAPKAEFPKHLKAVHRALKPGGHLFLGLKIGEGEARDHLGRFYAYYQVDELRDLMRRAAFTELHLTVGEGKGLAGDVSPFVLLIAMASKNG